MMLESNKTIGSNSSIESSRKTANSRNFVSSKMIGNSTKTANSRKIVSNKKIENRGYSSLAAHYYLFGTVRQQGIV